MYTEFGVNIMNENDYLIVDALRKVGHGEARMKILEAYCEYYYQYFVGRIVSACDYHFNPVVNSNYELGESVEISIRKLINHEYTLHQMLEDLIGKLLHKFEQQNVKIIGSIKFFEDTSVSRDQIGFIAYCPCIVEEQIK